MDSASPLAPEMTAFRITTAARMADLLHPGQGLRPRVNDEITGRKLQMRRPAREGRCRAAAPGSERSAPEFPLAGIRRRLLRTTPVRHEVAQSPLVERVQLHVVARRL